jgi:DNA-binding response OmpR family regulator
MKPVLIIDDEPGIAELVSWCLDSVGVKVILASGLQSALQMGRDHDIGLVLLDFDLGDEDGLDILPRLKDDPNFKDVPVVAFTAHDSRRAEALELGVASFIGRPFANVDLQSAVELHLMH